MLKLKGGCCLLVCNGGKWESVAETLKTLFALRRQRQVDL